MQNFHKHTFRNQAGLNFSLSLGVVAWRESLDEYYAIQPQIEALIEAAADDILILRLRQVLEKTKRLSQNLTTHQFIKLAELTITPRLVSARPNARMDWEGAQHYRVQIQCGEMKTTVYYSMGSANGAFNEAEFLDCIANECDIVENNYEDVSATDRQRDALRRQRDALKEVLGDTLYFILLWNVDEI